MQNVNSSGENGHAEVTAHETAVNVSNLGQPHSVKGDRSTHAAISLPDAQTAEEKSGFFASIRKQPKVFGWCMYACLTLVVVSFESVATGSVIGMPRFRRDFGRPYAGDYVLSAGWQAAFLGGPRASCVVATLFSGILADKYGRKLMIMASLALSFVGYTLEVTAETNEHFFAGKIINGMTLGVIMSVAMTYFSEVSAAFYG